MYMKLKKLVSILIPSVFLFAYFLLPFSVSADTVTIPGTCRTAETFTGNFDTPVIDTATGNVTVEAQEEDIGTVQFALQGFSTGCVANTLYSQGVSYEQFDSIGLRWLGATQIEFYNFTTNTPIGTAFDFSSADPAQYELGFVFSGYHGVTQDFWSSHFQIERTGTVSWQQPQNSVTPDFENWYICINVPAEYEAFYINVYFGLTEDLPTYANMESSLNKTGLSYTGGESFNYCGLFKKDTSLSPGLYSAIIELYDGEDTLLDISERLDFQIVAGTKIMHAGVSQSSASFQCSDRFNGTWFTFSGVDIPNPAYGICQVGVFLFVPSEETAASFNAMRENLATKPPQSIFYDIKDLFSSVGSADTLPEVTFNVAIGAGEADVTMLSEDTVDEYVSSGTQTAIRTLLVGGMWFGAGMYMLHESRKMFNKGQS